MSENVTDKEHHLYGGSSAKYWSNCFGWASIVKDIPQEPAGEAALRGTALHTGVLEVKVRGEIQKLTDGTPVLPDYSIIPNWPEEGEALAEEFWTLLFEKELEGFITGKQIYIERKLMLSQELDAGGTADIVILYHNDKGKLVAVVGDCKFGRISVDAGDEQLKFYLTTLNKLAREKGKQIDVFKSFIYQPETFPNWKEHTFTKSEIEKAEAKYNKAIAESKKEKPKFKVGDWCEWCKARGRCDAYTKHLDKEMELTVIRNQDLNTVQFINVAETPTDTLVKIHRNKAKIKNLFTAVDKELIIRLANGEKNDEIKIVEGVTKRKFKDTEEVVDTMKAHGVNPFKAAPIMGIGDMTKALMLAKDIPKKEADLIINPLTVKPEGRPKITSIDDPAPAFSFSDPAKLLEGLDDDSEF
jgi:hypothetical protein